MKLLHGQELVTKLRNLSDSVSKRLWIAVPYIGSPTSIRKILGKHWFDTPSVSVRLLTDISDLSNITTETIQLFHERGEVKTLLGLHAKIYIIDNACIISSANLTNTAFSKRYEIGILISDVSKTIETFERWWEIAENIKQNDLNKVFKIKSNSEEETRPVLSQLWNLPYDPGPFIKNLQTKFLHYGRLVSDFKIFADKYSSIQRLWPNKPIFLEIDGLFNFLYHEAENTPSFNFAKEKPRQLTEKQQLREIKKWALRYKQWNGELDEDDIAWRIRNSKKVKQLLSSQKINNLSEGEVREALLCTNSLGSQDRRNIAMIFQRNKVEEIKTALNELINGKGQLETRMNTCNRVKNLGAHSIYEILGLYYPEKYPTINKNSSSGLRFFGFQIKAYN